MDVNIDYQLVALFDEVVEACCGRCIWRCIWVVFECLHPFPPSCLFFLSRHSGISGQLYAHAACCHSTLPWGPLTLWKHKPKQTFFCKLLFVVVLYHSDRKLIN